MKCSFGCFSQSFKHLPKSGQEYYRYIGWPLYHLRSLRSLKFENYYYSWHTLRIIWIWTCLLFNSWYFTDVKKNRIHFRETDINSVYISFNLKHFRAVPNTFIIPPTRFIFIKCWHYDTIFTLTLWQKYIKKQQKKKTRTLSEWIHWIYRSLRKRT